MQVPLLVTVFPAEHHTDIIPVELTAWWLSNLGLKVGDWVLTVGEDINAKVPAHLLVRGGMGVNIVHGVHSLTASQVTSFPSLS